MLRDNLVELIEPLQNSAGTDLLALGIYHQKPASEDSLSCLENPRPEGAESSLTDNVTSPFPAEPRHRSQEGCRLVAPREELLSQPSIKRSRDKSKETSATQLADSRPDTGASKHQFCCVLRPMAFAFKGLGYECLKRKVEGNVAFHGSEEPVKLLPWHAIVIKRVLWHSGT